MHVENEHLLMVIQSFISTQQLERRNCAFLARESEFCRVSRNHVRERIDGLVYPGRGFPNAAPPPQIEI